MSLFNKSPSQITENDLLALIADKETEGKTLDYKRDAVGNGDLERKEFLYDASSFANTQGGFLIFGMEESNGLPTNLVGLANFDADKERLRLDHMLRDGIRPPITRVETAPVPLANGNVALVMHIPKSWNPPHQVTYQKTFRFYARGSNGKYQVDVDELRSVFSLSASAAERLRLFRIERITKIVSGDAPIPLGLDAKMITHILPLSAFTGRGGIDLNLIWRDPSPLVGLLNHGGTPSFNIDGVWLGSNQANGSRYVQIFRDGSIEIVSDFSEEASKRLNLPCPAFERIVINQLRHAKLLYHAIDVTPPIVVMLSMAGMRGWQIATDSGRSRGTFDRDPVFVPELVLENFEGHNQDEIRPVLDCVWNAAGSPCSPNYDAQGRRKREDS